MFLPAFSRIETTWMKRSVPEVLKLVEIRDRISIPAHCYVLMPNLRGLFIRAEES
jgi:hypothetical protein